MPAELEPIKRNFIEGLSRISHFWGFPKSMGAIFAVLYLSPAPLSLDDLVAQTGFTKGAISASVRALARLALVHRQTKLGDRKDYYVAETDFYKASRTILKGRENSEFDRAITSVRETLTELKAAAAAAEDAELQFLLERVQALQDFFDALDALTSAIARLQNLGLPTIQKVLSILK
ncbi:MAG: hypothetical protein GXP40_02595 [Chloroflexi bacterium]|nr:hypothetical protein [Chloroflexota bacterium]